MKHRIFLLSMMILALLQLCDRRKSSSGDAGIGQSPDKLSQKKEGPY
jgi:hypothetical protein